MVRSMKWVSLNHRNKKHKQANKQKSMRNKRHPTSTESDNLIGNYCANYTTRLLKSKCMNLDYFLILYLHICSQFDMICGFIYNTLLLKPHTDSSL